MHKLRSLKTEFKPTASEEQGMNSNEGTADTAAWQLRLCRSNQSVGI